MNEQLTPEIEEEDDGMTEMVNVSDETILVRITQGRRRQKVRVAPGKSALFPSGYCCDVKGAGRLVLPSILTRQSLRADRVHRLVRVEDAQDARARFEERTYGTMEENASNVERLRAELAAAEAREEVVSRGIRSEPLSAAEIPLRKMNRTQLQDLAIRTGIEPEQTKAQLVAALESHSAGE